MTCQKLNNRSNFITTSPAARDKTKQKRLWNIDFAVDYIHVRTKMSAISFLIQSL